jgi:hypothetical protein
MSDERFADDKRPHIAIATLGQEKIECILFHRGPIGLLNAGDVAEGVAGWRLVLAHVIDSSEDVLWPAGLDEFRISSNCDERLRGRTAEVCMASAYSWLLLSCDSLRTVTRIASRRLNGGEYRAEKLKHEDCGFRSLSNMLWTAHVTLSSLFARPKRREVKIRMESGVSIRFSSAGDA